MVEIPEHLLQRSRERRAALGLGGGAEGAAPAAGAPAEGAAAAADAATPAVAAPVEVEQAPAAPPPPPPPYVEAALRRRRIPYWAMPVVFLLPLWAILYAGTLSEADTGEPTQVEVGAMVFANNCATCHGSTGGGGVGPQLNDGNVLQTFTSYEDQMRWVAGGSASAVNGKYGSDLQKTSKGGMPTFAGNLTPAEILAVVRYEREGLPGEEPADPSLIDPATENLLHDNGSPYLDTDGATVLDADGNPLFDSAGNFIGESQQAIPLDTPG